MKKCTKCNEIKDLSEFHKHKISKDGLKPRCILCRNNLSKKYYKNNKEAVIIKTTQYKINNKEKVSKAWKRYYLKNQPTILEKHKQYYDQNKELIRAKNHVHYTNNKGHYNAKCNKRRAQKLNASIGNFDKELKEIYKNCPKDYHVDHIIPFTHKDVCGLHVPWNLQYLQAKDNLKKHNQFDGTLENKGWVCNV